VVAVSRRNTSQRTAILQILAGTEEFVTAQELHSALRDSGTGIGLATVYRALSDMVAAGEVDTLRSPAGETLYRQCGESMHHHHLVCRICGRTEEVTAPGVERWARAVADEYGFVDINHEVELFGVCGDCARSRS
jgi:Fur family ferric uptake transcriptional regulator